MRADTVVGETAVELVDDCVCTEEGDTVAGVHGSVTEGDGEMALAGAGRTDESQVAVLGSHSRGQVVEGGVAQRGDREVEVLQGLMDREGGQLEPHAAVGLVARLALLLDEHAQELLGRQRWVRAVWQTSGAT